MKPRYIDANKLNKKKKYSFQTQKGCFPKSEWFIKADDLFAAPTEDVVKVVRCMDCIYFKTNINKENYCDIHSTTWDKFYVRDDDFCSYGERKEGADNGKD